MSTYGGGAAHEGHRAKGGNNSILQPASSNMLLHDGGLPIKTFSQFKHEQYRTITVIWALIVVAAYCISLYRTPVQGNYAHWAMVLSLQMLCLTVAVASRKGSAKDLRTATFALWLLRTCWFVLLSMGVMNLSFQGALGPSNVQTSYPSLTSWTTVLFNIIAMVHLPRPHLLLSIQALTLSVLSIKLGKPALPSIIQSLVVHGACGIVNMLLERRDRSCYTLMVQRERQARTRAHQTKGSCSSIDDCGGVAGAGISGKATADDCCVVHSASALIGPSSQATTTTVMSSILFPDTSLSSSAQASSCISCPISAVALHSRTTHTDDASSLAASSPHLGSYSMLPIHASADRGVQAMSEGLHTSTGRELRASSEGVASLRSAVLAQWDAVQPNPDVLRRVQQTVGRLRNRRPTYKQRYHKYQVVVKIPCASRPEDLPDSAVPRLVSILQERNPGCIVSGTATRSGCILVKLDLQRAVLASAGKTETFQALATAAQAWLQETELDAQLLGKPVLIQVDDALGELVLDTGSRAWSMQPFGVLTQTAPGSEEDYGIKVNTLAVLMPPTSSPREPQDLGRRHQDQYDSSSSAVSNKSCAGSSGCSTVSVQACVRVPMGVRIAGWSRHPSDLDGRMEAGAQVVGEGSRNNRQLEQGGDDVALVQVLANVQGYGYAATCLAKVPPGTVGDCPSERGDNEGCSYKVCVSVPEHVAAHGWPRLLRLELWHGDVLLSSSSSSSSILLPACMPGAASELQGLPWGCEDTEDLADYITDLGHWLHKNRAGSVTPSSSDPAAQAEHDEEQQQQWQQQQRAPTPWEVGVSLLQQSVLWGLPSVSTLLVDTLMGGLPSAPADAPFALLAHAPVRDATAAAASQQGAGQDGGGVDTKGMGGLLHLSLLCPHASSMLAAVLDWGRRWGSKEPGFAWGWNERSSIGFTPLDILSTLPKDSEVLQLLLGDPELAVVLLTAALQRARDRGAAPAPASATWQEEQSARGNRGSQHQEAFAPESAAEQAELRTDNARGRVGSQDPSLPPTQPRPQGMQHPGLSGDEGALPLDQSIQSAAPTTTAATIHSPSALPTPETHSPGKGPPAAPTTFTTECNPCNTHAAPDPDSQLQQLSNLLLSVFPLKYSLLTSLRSLKSAASRATADSVASCVAHTFPTAAAAAATVSSAASRLSVRMGYAATHSEKWILSVVTRCGAAMRADHAFVGMIVVPQTLRGTQQEQHQHQQSESSCSSGLAVAPVTPALPIDVSYSEADYRAWANAQAAPMAHAWLLFEIGTLAIIFAKDLVLKDASAALMELKGVCPFICVFVSNILLLRLFPEWTEVSIAGMTLGRSLVQWLLALGVLPLTRVPCHILSSPLLVVFEVLLSSCFEQVRLTWVAPLRIALFFSYKELCSRAKISQPWVYSAQVSVGGVLVAVAIDLHMRRLYTQRMQRQMVQMGMTFSECTGGICLKKMTGGGGSGGGGDRDGPCAHSVRNGGGGCPAAAAAAAGIRMRAISGTPHQHVE